MVREHGGGSYTASRLHPSGAAAHEPASTADDPMLTDMMDYYLIRKTESYKFIRMADDLHDVASYLNEMRICFLLLTGTVYIILAFYFVNWCVRRNRRRVNNPTTANGRRLPNHRWGELQGNDYENAVTAQTNVGGGQTGGGADDLVSVRSDGALPPGKAQIGPGASQFGMAGRGAPNRQAAPSFMRHSGVAAASMQNHSAGGGGAASATTALLASGGTSATTRLMAADTETGTATMMMGGGGMTQQQQPSSALLTPSTAVGGIVHHSSHEHHQHHQLHHHQHHHQPQHQQQQQQPQQQHSPHSPHQPQSECSSTTTTLGRPPGCLLNNIVEEKETNTNGTGGTNSASSSTTGTMSTFGWRNNKEKIILERHELQSLAGGNGNSQQDIL